MKKSCFTALLTCILLLGACTTPNHQQTPLPLRVATNAEFPPFESVNPTEKLQGFDIDLMNAMAKAGHFTVQWQSEPWDGIFERLAKKQSDAVIAAVVIKQDRLETMDFTEPYFNVRKVILTWKTSKNLSAKNFKNKPIAVVKGQSSEAAANELFGKKNPNIKYYDNLAQALDAVGKKHVHGMIGDSPVLENYLKTHPHAKLHLVELPQLAQQHYGIAVSKGNSAVLQQLNHALQTVRESGRYDGIYRQYFAP